jgi:hypothetical protein
MGISGDSLDLRLLLARQKNGQPRPGFRQVIETISTARFAQMERCGGHVTA